MTLLFDDLWQVLFRIQNYRIESTRTTGLLQQNDEGYWQNNRKQGKRTKFTSNKFIFDISISIRHLTLESPPLCSLSVCMFDFKPTSSFISQNSNRILVPLLFVSLIVSSNQINESMIISTTNNWSMRQRLMTRT